MLNQKKIMFHDSRQQNPHQALGSQGEERVANYLKLEGFVILERNYKKFYGEIDLIAQKKDLIAFVEVKTRKKAYFELSQLITPSKQHKIIKTAQSYIARYHFTNTIFRFDVALLESSEEGTQLHYIPNAFTKKTH